MAEIILRRTDPGSRFWRPNNIQISSLRAAQSIIVGRVVIIADIMMRLPDPDEFNAEWEESRFGWLLYGTKAEMYEIHGGCGFSKKLLHVISQISYCAGRLQQDPESPFIPVTANYLHKELLDMRQWSGESRNWETAIADGPTIDWVRSLPSGYTLNTSQAMTDVTAEAWRLAVILYLLCRLKRYVLQSR